MMQVEVPTTLTTSPLRQPAPMASQCASKAPTGIGMPRFQAQLFRPFLREMAGRSGRKWRIGRRAFRARLQTADRLWSGTLRPAVRPSASVPHPLVAHGADAARDLRRIGDAAEHGRHHVAVFERGSHARALLRIVAQPVQQLGESPLRGIDAAAPVDGFQLFGACAASVMSRASLLGAMVAPEIVIVERIEAARRRESRSIPSYRARSPGYPCPVYAGFASALRVAETSAFM